MLTTISYPNVHMIVGRLIVEKPEKHFNLQDYFILDSWLL